MILLFEFRLDFQLRLYMGDMKKYSSFLKLEKAYDDAPVQRICSDKKNVATLISSFVIAS